MVFKWTFIFFTCYHPQTIDHLKAKNNTLTQRKSKTQIARSVSGKFNCITVNIMGTTWYLYYFLNSLEINFTNTFHFHLFNLVNTFYDLFHHICITGFPYENMLPSCWNPTETSLVSIVLFWELSFCCQKLVWFKSLCLTHLVDIYVHNSPKNGRCINKAKRKMCQMLYDKEILRELEVSLYQLDLVFELCFQHRT